MVTVLATVLSALNALAPAFVTYAQLPPTGVTCTACGSPEIQAALAHAAAIGREQVQSLLRANAWFTLCLTTIAVTAACTLLWLSGRTKAPRQ